MNLHLFKPKQFEPQVKDTKINGIEDLNTTEGLPSEKDLKPESANEKGESLEQQMFNFLQEKKVLEKKDDYNIVDFDELFNKSFQEDINQHCFSSVRRANLNRGTQGSYRLLFEAMSDLQIVSKTDYEVSRKDGKKPEAKAFFNVPDSIDEAFNVDKTRNKNFYFNFWDAHSKDGGSVSNWDYQIKAKDGSEIGARELQLFQKIFIENQGRRDEDGKLLVFDKDKNSFVRLSVDWLNKYSGGSFHSSYTETQGVHSFIKNKCPIMSQRGLIKPKDFKIVSGFPGAELYRIEKEVENDYVMFFNVRYYIGKEYFKVSGNKIQTNELKVVQLDNSRAGIVRKFKGNEDLIYTFDFLTDEEKQDKIDEYEEKKGKKLSAREISSRILVGKKEMNLRLKSWDVAEENHQHQGETDAEYDERKRTIKSFQHIKEIEKDFAEKCGFGIHNLSWREQQWLTSAVYELGENEFNERLLPFAKKFGLAGLRTFLSFEFDKKMASNILDMGVKLEKNKAEEIFLHYAGIQEKATSLQKMLDKIKELPDIVDSDNLMQKIKGSAYDALMSRATDILNTAHQIAQQGKASAKFYNGEKIKIEDMKEVINALGLYENSLEKIFGFFSGQGDYDFNYAGSNEQKGLQLHNFSIENKKTGDLSYSLISLRKEGTNEYSKNFEFDGEARINFLFNIKPISENIQNESRRQALSIRLDRECLNLDGAGKKIGPSDYTRTDGRLSLDLGSVDKDSGRDNNTLSKVVSVGNFFTAQEKNHKPEYYHNKESFYHELGQADVFKKIVEMIDDFIKLKYVDDKKELALAA